MKASPIQESFNTGELSPLLAGRAGLEAYRAGLETCTGYVPLIQGPLKRRSGTVFTEEVADSASATRVVPFAFSPTQAYILEFSDELIRFYRNNALVLNSSQPYEVATPYAAADLFELDISTQSGDVLYIFHPDYAPRKLQRFADDEWQLSEIDFLDGPYLPVNATGTPLILNPGSGAGTLPTGTTAVTLSAAGPAITNGLFGANINSWTVSSAAVAWAAAMGSSPDGGCMAFDTGTAGTHTADQQVSSGVTAGEPLTLTFTGIQNGFSAVVGTVLIGTSQGASDLGSAAISVSFAGNTNTITFTPPSTSFWIRFRLTATGNAADSDMGIDNVVLGSAIFASTDVGRLVRLKLGPSTTWTWVKITAYTNATTVTVTIRGPLATKDTSTLDWRLGAWSDTTGWPAAGAFFEDRLALGGATSYPQRVDLSKTSDYENFEPTAAAGTIADDNAISLTLNGRSINTIRWITDDEKALLIGTNAGVWSVRASVLSEALSPTNASAKKSTANGSAAVQPVQAGTSTIFVHRAGRKVLACNYDGNREGFAAIDITRLSTHMTASGIKEMAYQEEPHNVVWCLRNDGVVVGVTFNEDDKVIGWHRHIVGGSFGSGAAVVESIAVIPNSDGDADELWMVVKRTIDGQTVRYVEYVAADFDQEADQEDAFFVDSGLTYSGAPVSSVSGLDHLEGEEVTILADGATHPSRTVSGGSVTLARSASKIHVGLSFVTQGSSLRFDVGSEDGTAQGKLQRVHRATIRVDRSLGLRVGPSLDALDEISFRNASDPTNAAVPLFTGDKLVRIDGKYETGARVCWDQPHPLPSTIVALMPQLVTQDR